MAGVLGAALDIYVPQPSLRSSASSRKRQAPTAPVVHAVKRLTPVVAATGAVEARVVPVVNTVVVPTVTAVPAVAVHQQVHPTSEPTSLQDAIKYLVKSFSRSDGFAYFGKSLTLKMHAELRTPVYQAAVLIVL